MKNNISLSHIKLLTTQCDIFYAEIVFHVYFNTFTQ